MIKKTLKFIIRVISFFERKISNLKLRTLISEIGKTTTGHWSVIVKYGENISVGENTTIGPYTTLGGMNKIVIGNYVRISKGVVIETAGLNLNAPPPYKHKAKPINIKDGAWIATNAIILGGVTIGENAIIGAGCVISKDVPDNSIIVGQPIRELTKKISRN